MKKDIINTTKLLASMPEQLRRRYYQLKISQHSPPKTAHDRFMLKIYRGLLDRPDDLQSLEEFDQRPG